MATQSLAALIRADDPDAIAGFRDAHVAKVRAYCEAACGDEGRDDAVAAAFIEFLGRVGAADRDVDLDELLLKATRSVAAGRFEVAATDGAESDGGQRTGAALDPICLAIPELLAADANRELPGVDRETLAHVERCHTCAATKARADAAERAFAGADAFAGESEAPAAEPEAPAAEPEAPAAAPPPSHLAPPLPAAPPAPPAPAPTAPAIPPAPTTTIVRARRGGLVGAARRMLRPNND